MSIKVLYFASLKEKIGRASDEIEVVDMVTVAGVWHKANPYRIIPKNTLAALNMDYVDLQTRVKDGDEVAFFPRVTGG